MRGAQTLRSCAGRLRLGRDGPGSRANSELVVGADEGVRCLDLIEKVCDRLVLGAPVTDRAQRIEAILVAVAVVSVGVDRLPLADEVLFGADVHHAASAAIASASSMMSAVTSS